MGSVDAQMKLLGSVPTRLRTTVLNIYLFVKNVLRFIFSFDLRNIFVSDESWFKILCFDLSRRLKVTILKKYIF